MSYGILVQNPGINRVILDEDNPIYVVPPVRAVGLGKGLVRTDSYGWVGDRDDFMFQVWTFQEFELRFRFPLTGLLPPLTFIRPTFPASHPAMLNTDRDPVSIRIYNEVSLRSGYGREGWQSNIWVTPLGGKGMWTGVKVRVEGADDWRISGSGSSVRRQQDRFQEAVLDYMPDLSQYFLAVGYGVEPRPGDYGILVRNADGEVVFNSNSNTVTAVGCSSRWTYLDRRGGNGSYVERWRLAGAAVPNDVYRLVVPNQTYRRYNGEEAQVYMYNYKGQPVRHIVGGRSGSPAFTPMMWINPIKPLERW